MTSEPTIHSIAASAPLNPIERLERRLERERRARLEAEAIAEHTTRALYDKQRELRLLQEIASAANEAHSLDQVLQLALHEICDYTGWPVGHAYVRDESDSARLLPTRLWHCDEPSSRFTLFRDMTEATPLPIGTGFPGRVLATAQPVWIDDVTRDVNFPRAQVARDISVRAAFAFPVVVEGEVVAVLEFFCEQSLPPDESLLQLLTHIGTQLGRVAERNRARRLVESSELRYRAVSELTSDYAYCFRIDPSGAVVVEWMVGAVEAITGYTVEELQRNDQGFRLVHPQDQETALRRVQRLLFGHGDASEFRIIAKDGTVRWLRESGRPEFGSDGRVERVYCAAQDITARKLAEAEVQQLNADLERRVAQRTEALSDANAELEAFSYSVSHDLRAPLRSINGFSQIMAQDYSDQLDDRGRECLEILRNAGQRMTILIDALLGLARVARAEMHWVDVDLSDIAERVVAELRNDEPERCVEIVIQPGLTTRGDPRLLSIVLGNLLRNAWKYTAKHASARIELGSMEEAGVTRYFVRDDGAGFDMAYADRLFRPFQRLHPRSAFPGDGIGLATVQRIIRRHDGYVRAEGKVEGGATISFSLAEAKAWP